MTIKDFLKMPTGMTPEQWEETLKEQEKIRKKIIRLSNERDSLEDGYELTGDKKFKDNLDKVNSKIDKLVKCLI